MASLPPITELIQVEADGVPYEGWEEIIVEWGMADPVFVTFQLKTTEIPTDQDKDWDVFSKWNFPPGTNVMVYASGDPFIQGYIHSYNPTMNKDQHSIVVTGVTYGKDFVDSSVKVDTSMGNYENMTDSQIIQSFAAAAGVSMSDYTTPIPIPNYQVKQGGTNWQESARILQNTEKTMMSILPSGDLAIVGDAPFYINTDGALIQGENILEMSANLTADQYDVIEVIGQAPEGTDDKQHLQVFGIAQNTSPFGRASRYRRIIDQMASTTIQASRRARWQLLRSYGATTQAIITVAGWRDFIGRFWAANTDVYVNAPVLKIDCMMRVYKIIFRQSIGTGTICTITLVDPTTFGGEPILGLCKSDSMWVPWVGGKPPT